MLVTRTAAGGRLRATTVAGTLTAALCATAFTAIPAAAVSTPTGTVFSDLSGWDFSDTRVNGHESLVDGGLRIWTDGASDSINGTNQDKAAGYFGLAAPVALADAGEPTLAYDATVGNLRPGYQLVVDLDGNGSVDGILVGEPSYADGTALYGDNWWLASSTADFKSQAPSHTAGHEGGFGSEDNGTLDEWRTVFPNADVTAIGYSLGSGVLGDGVIRSFTLGSQSFSFAPAAPVAACTTTTDALVSTDTNAHGWSFGESGSNGQHEYVDGGLRVSTEANPETGTADGTSKSAGYVATDFPLSAAGEPSLVQDVTSGAKAGLNLVIYVDGSWNGTLTYESDIQNGNPEHKWWGTRAIPGVPAGPAGFSYIKAWATLDQIVAATYGRHNVRVEAVGYSLGSGAVGDTTIHSLTAGCTTYAFTREVGPTVYPAVGDGGVATDAVANGWTVSSPDTTSFVADGVQLSDQDWSESYLERDYSGDLASLGDVDFDATPSQYVGIHVHTAKGWLTYEKEASYAGKWWSTDDFGVDSGDGYASFASLSDYITANPGLQVDKVRVLYTSDAASTTTIHSVTFGGERYTFRARFATSVEGVVTKGVYGQAGSVAVTVSDDQAIVPTGTVTLTEGAFSVTGTLADGRATLALPATLAVGDHTFTLAYTGDTTVAPKTVTVGATVSKASAGITSIATKGAYGTTGTVAITVAARTAVGDAVTSVVPTGTVTVASAGFSATATLTGGKATVTLPASLTVGDHLLTVTYSGDGNVAAAYTEVGVGVPLVTSYLFSTDIEQIAGTAGALPVFVVPGTATGTITVTSGSTTVGSAKLEDGAALVAISKSLSAGQHVLTVSYSGNGTVAASSTTVTVYVEKSAATLSATWSGAHYGTAATVKVSVRGAAGAATGTVSVYEGSKKLTSTTLSGGKATLSLSKTLKVGAHKLSLRYSGSSTVEAKSASKSLTVAKATSKSVVKLSSSKVKASQHAKATVTVTAPNLKVGGKVTIVVKSKTGKTVSVKATVKSGKATASLPKLKAGSYKVSVNFAGSSTVRSSVSVTVGLTVK